MNNLVIDHSDINDDCEENVPNVEIKKYIPTVSPKRQTTTITDPSNVYKFKVFFVIFIYFVLFLIFFYFIF